MMKKQTLSLLLLLATSGSVHAFTLPETFTHDDDMTSFDDLAAAGNHLREKIQEEAKSNNFLRISALANTYNKQRSTYECYRNQCNKMLKESYQNEGHKIRSSWQWRDYTIATAVAGTLTGTIATLYELTQQQYLTALACAALTTSAYFTWGFGAEWADNARFKAAHDLEEKLKAEKECTEEYKELSQKKDRAEIEIIQAYTRLKISRPWTPKAQAAVSKATLPKELCS